MSGRAYNEEDFGRDLCKLFAEYKFDEAAAKRHFKDVPVRPYLRELLSLPADVFLVSLGPNYYVHELARQNGIPLERVCCSQYSFKENGGLIDKCDALSPTEKQAFVEEQSRKYLLTIGVGDHEQFDAPFIDKCMVKVFLSEKQGYFSTKGDLEAIKHAVRAFDEGSRPWLAEHQTPRMATLVVILALLVSLIVSTAVSWTSAAKQIGLTQLASYLLIIPSVVLGTFFSGFLGGIIRVRRHHGLESPWIGAGVGLFVGGFYVSSHFVAETIPNPVAIWCAYLFAFAAGLFVERSIRRIELGSE